MHAQTKKDISYLIQDNLSAIKDPSNKIRFMINPELPEEMKGQYVVEVSILVDKLEAQCKELEPFIFAIKMRVGDITEQTIVCGIYLLMCSVLSEWESVFFLARKGKYSSVMAILRKISEALDQCQLFSFNYIDGENKHINDWLSGKIVGNDIARQRLDRATPDEVGVDVSSLLAHLYQMESNSAHNGYESMLESVSPFTEDVDFNGPTGYYRVQGALHGAHSNMTDFIQTLRATYMLVLKDPVGEVKLEEILKKHDPRIREHELIPAAIEAFKKR